MPLLQGVTPSGYACDLGLSAYADDVAKKVVGRSEKELFEALADKVLDEELEVGGWKRNMDKREVVPMMKDRRPGFDLKKKSEALWRVRDIWEDVSRATATIGRSCSAERQRYALRGSQLANSGQ